MISYRNATKDDINFLVSLREKTMRQHIEKSCGKYSSEEQLKRVMYEFTSAKIIVFDKKDIGLLKLKKNKDIWELIQIQLLPEYQNNGLGGLILQKIINDSKEGKVDIILDVFKSNPAQKLYKKNGFQIIEEKERSYTMRFISNII